MTKRITVGVKKAGASLRLLAAGGALAALVLLWPAAAQAATFTVNTTIDTVDVSPGNGVCADSGGHCSLRAAVMEANALAGADTIILPAGDYLLTRPWVSPGDGIIESDDSAGDLDLNSSITISGAGSGTTIIEGGVGWNDGIIDVNSNLVRAFLLGQALPTPGNVTISGVTIQGGHSTEALQNGGEGAGVGVYLWGPQGSFTIQNSVIQNNITDHGYGGGIGILNGQAASSVEAATVQITGTSFINNWAKDAAGGGLFAGGYVPVTITDSTFSNNTSGGANPRNLVPGGGGLFLEYDGTLSTITGAVITGNVTNDGTADDSDGGGMFTARAVNMKNSTVSGNTADRNGGGIDLIHTGALSSTFTNVTISGNLGYGDGGGLHVQLQNAAGQGFAPNATLTNVTITNNRADSNGNSTGTAGGVFRQNTDGTLTLRNTILAGNYVGGSGTTASDAAGAITGTYNLFGTGGSGTLSGGTGNQYNVANPGLAPLADNGGRVQTHALLSGSPALDAGSNALVTETADARGAGFPRLLDAADADTVQTVDLGALEMHPTVEAIADKVMLQDTSFTYQFNVGDATLGFTSITATSANTALVPNNPANLAVSAGSGASNRTLTILPTTGQGGTATITVTVTAVENGVTMTSTDSFLLTVQKRPDLTITKSHAGNFRQGDTNKSYTITVSNKATAGPSLRPSDPLAPAGTTDVKISDTFPAGLTITSGATKWTGTNWTCVPNGAAYECTYAASVQGGANASTLTLFVDVADNAGTPVTNAAAVSGGAESPATLGDNSATDPTVIIQTADLTVTKSHSGDFRQGESGVTYSIRVSNIGPGPTDAAFSLTDTLPAGLTPTAANPPAGEGWTCSIAAQTVTCSRGVGSPLVNGTFSDLTLTVDAAPNAATAPPNQVTNAASVTGGGELASRTGNNTASDLTNIIQMPNLTVSQAANGTFQQGLPASYTLTVSNIGYAPTDGTTVTLTDTLPAGLTYSSFSGTNWTCGAAGQTVTCTSTDVIAGGSSFPAITLNVDVSPTAGSPVVNDVSIDGGGQIYHTDDAAAPLSTTVLKAPDLAIAKSHTGSFTQGDTNKTFTVTVTNNAGAGATSQAVTVSDALPAGLSYVSAIGTGWSCSVAGQTVTCNRSDALSAGAAYPDITLTVDVAANAPASLVNTASVSGGGELSVTLADNSAGDTVPVVQLPDLTVGSQHSDPLLQGQSGAVYTITVSNQGSGLTGGTVTVTDTLPTGLTFDSFAGADWNCVSAGQTVTCTSSAVIGAGGTSQFTLSVTVARDAASSLTNTVSVAGAGEQAGQTGNNSATDPTAVTPMPDLAVAQAENGAFRQGQPAGYTMTVANSGFAPTDGTTVTVTDTLPAELTYTGFAGTNWTCGAAGQTVTCTSTDVVAGGSDFPAITVNVDVASNAGSPVVNAVSVDGGGQIYHANDAAAPLSTTVLKAPDLTLSKSHTGSFTQGDMNRTYTITVANQAGAGATFQPVTVTDTLPADLSFAGAVGTGWTCNAAAGTVTCNRSDALSGGAAYPDITLTVDVTATAPPALVNTASVSGGGELGTSLADNTVNDTTTVVQLPDLSIQKSHAADFSQGQTGALYTITVSNIGTGETQGTITVTDVIPAGLTPQAVGSSDFTCSITGQTVTCTRTAAMAANASSTIGVTVDVAPVAPGSVTNTAAVSVAGDVNAGNNSADDPTAIVQKADLTVLLSHAGDFRQGQQGAQYNIHVHNGGTAPTVGTVTLTDVLPADLAFAGGTGTGWTCSATGQTVTCSSSDVVAAGQDFPDVALAVNVSATAAPSLNNTVAVAGGGEVITGNDTASDPTNVTQVADLTVAKSHSGTFTQGDNGKTYTITVSNTGAGPTDALVTLTDSLPVGLSPVSAAGTGWTCSIAGQTVTCNRSDALATGTDYPPITLTVNVGATASATLMNSVTVAGGGEAVMGNDSATDSTTVVQLPNLTISKSHTGTFHLGHKDLPYTLVVTNSGQGATSGVVTVTDTLPAGLTASGLSGAGWTCDLPSLTCTRSDSLAGGGSYPPITLKVDVKGNAPSSVTNHTAVSGGGEIILTDDSADDVTPIAPEPPRPTPVPPPPGPRVKITAPVAITAHNSVLVQGTANPFASVQVGSVSVKADAAGNWSATVPLSEGSNLITATSGAASDAVTVVRDTVPPTLTLTASALLTDAETVDLKAVSEVGARVRIGDAFVTALRAHLTLGANTFTATAVDLAGNTSTASVTVTRVSKGRIPTEQDVDPDQSVKLSHRTWTFDLPAHMAGAPVRVVIQAPEPSEATRKAEAEADVLSMAVVDVTSRTDNSEVHQLLRTVTITFAYDPAQVPDPSRLQIFWFDPAAGQWVNLGGVVDPLLHTIRVETDHFSLFSALVPKQVIPVMDALPATTSQSILTVTGTAGPGAPVTLMLNGVAQASGSADQTGRFGLPATLAEGRNEILVNGGALSSSRAVVVYQPVSVTPPTQPALTDIAGHWAAQSIRNMVQAGVILGYDDGTFRPEQQVNRLEFAVMVTRLLHLAPGTGPLPFTDSDRIPAWAKGPVAAATAAGIMTGRDDGSFDPVAPINRAEIAAILVRALKVSGHTGHAGDAGFADSTQVPGWAQEAVSVAVNSGLVTGYPDGTFRPGGLATRAEAAKMLDRLQMFLVR